MKIGISLKKKSVTTEVKVPIVFKPKIRSRHPTHDALRGKLPAYNFRTVIRLGSTTPVEDIFPKVVERGGKVVEINTDDAIAVSANKLKMKKAFDDAGIKTAQWWIFDDKNVFIESGNGEVGTCAADMKFPIVAKHIFGSRGTGNHLLHSKEELNSFVSKCKDRKNYIFEKYYDYNREYRLHVNKDGCFYTCRKVLKTDTPQEKRWFRNDSNSNWIKEENELFDKPTTWDAIVADCVRALESIGLDFAAFDVRVQSAKQKNKEGKEQVRENPEWIVIESNSAPSYGTVTAEKYLEMLPKLIEDKYVQMFGK